MRRETGSVFTVGSLVLMENGDNSYLKESINDDWRSDGCPGRLSIDSRINVVFRLWAMIVFMTEDKGTCHAGFVLNLKHFTSSPAAQS